MSAPYHHRLVQMDGTRRAVERRIAEREDAAITGGEPVAHSVGCRGNADDWLIQVDGPSRSVELGIAVGEDAAVTGDEPVALTVRRGRHGNDRLGEFDSRSRR